MFCDVFLVLDCIVLLEYKRFVVRTVGLWAPELLRSDRHYYTVSVRYYWVSIYALAFH